MFKFIDKKNRQNLIILLVFIIFAASITQADDRQNRKIDFHTKQNQLSFSLEEIPIVEYQIHNRGNIQLAVGNNGTFGTFGRSIQDPFTGDAVQSCIYPKNSNIVFLWVGALWIGAVVGRDTLVTCATEDWYTTSELWPDLKPLGDFVIKSIDINSPFYSEDAYSEEDFICYYTDTLTNPGIVARDPIDNRPHKPLNIKVTQRTMAWSYSYADDFILFDYQIENIGFQDLDEVYLGIFVDGDVWHTTRNGPEGWNDDIVGFYRSHPAPGNCDFIDTINIAFTADNDGDPDRGAWDFRSTLSTVGSRVIRTPSDSLKYSYNWWIINYGDESRDFGPRRQETPDDKFRNFGGRLGTPAGDLNKYYVLSHEEFDYDLMYSAIDQTRNGWLRPPQFAQDYAAGYDARYLLSFGPFNVSPGEQLPITFAWIGGENFHQDPNDFENFFDPADPDKYYSKLNFSDLAINSRWASWVFDNPGVDTDGDGYLGKFRVCEGETTYYEGDGIPDFKGATPPPAPVFWVIPSSGKLKIRLNGFHSETTKDSFSNLRDFEGYRIYISRDERLSSYSVVASYDLEDFNRYIMDIDYDTTYSTNDNGDTTFSVSTSSEISLIDVPFTLDSLRCLYADNGCGDNSFRPLDYTRTSPLLVGDSAFYFEAQDYNASVLGFTTPFEKIYPDQPFPSTLNRFQVDPDELTNDGYFKYFEYEMTIENLLSTVPYWVNVTAFDFGSPVAGLASLETSLNVGTQIAYALNSPEFSAEQDLEVFVYPNPYRIDGNYTGGGYENRLGAMATERARLIHFANLPLKCTIRIFSLDGDLVKEIFHDTQSGDPTASHNEWDLITRNTQAVVSGLYYFVIESETKTQIGKFVIIK